MRRYAATCDDCPDWQHIAATRADAQRAADLHAGREHGEDLRTSDPEAFLRAYAPLAHRFARRAGLMASESYDEIYADALIGLWDAAQRFDPARGWKFSTFAGRRIVGAISDGRRQRDPLSRHFRKAGEANPLRLDMPLSHSSDTDTLGSLMPDPIDDYAASDDADEYSRRLSAVFAALPVLREKQRHVLLGRMAGEKLHVLADQLGVTESRASQLESEAVARLRHVLTAA